MLSITETLGRTKLKKVASYIDHDLYAKFEKLAESDSRSISQMLAVLIKKAVAEAEGEGKL